MNQSLETKAFEARHSSLGRVFRLAGRFFSRPQDVEEVAQETFLRAWLKLGTYRARAPFEHWLTRLCLRKVFRRQNCIRNWQLVVKCQARHSGTAFISLSG